MASAFQVSGFRIRYACWRPGQRVAWPRAVPGRLCVFLHGGMTEFTSRGQHQYFENHVVYKARNQRPALAFGPRGAGTVTVEFTSPSVSLPSGGREFFQDRGLAFRSVRCADVARRMLREIWAPDAFTPAVLQMLTRELLIEVMRHGRKASRPPPAWLQEVRSSILRRADPRASLAELAQGAQVHPVHLAQVFREHYGESLGRFIRRTTIERASQLIRTADKSLAQIGLELGFCDQSHFCRVFRKVTGFTPLEFRRLFRRP